MAEEVREGYYLDRPNRAKASSKATKAIVVLLLLVSAALTAIITFGGWASLQGAQPVSIGFIIVFLVMAFFVARWNRGVLPVAAGLYPQLITLPLYPDMTSEEADYVCDSIKQVVALNLRTG